MARTSNVQFIVDEHGRKKSVVMSYKTYQRLLEDLADLRCMEERKNDTHHDLESVLAELKDAGRI